jgi:hypothetical protein
VSVRRPLRRSVAVGLATGAFALASRCLHEAVDLAVSALHVATKLFLRLCAHVSNLVCRLGPHRGQELLGRHSRGLQLLLRPLLGIGERPVRSLFSLADDGSSRRLEPSLIEDCGGLFDGSRSCLLGFLMRPRN